MTLDELLAGLAEYIGDDKAKARDVATELNNNDATKPIATILVSRGISKRTADVEKEVDTLRAEVKRLTDEAEEKDREIEKTRSEAPDWKKRLEEQERRYQEKLATANANLAGERQARRDDRLAIHRARFLAELGPDVNVDREWAENVLAQKYADRFDLDENMELVVLEPDDTTPYDAKEGDPVKALARDVLRTVPTKYRIMGQAAPGGGTTGGASGDVKPKTQEQIIEAQRRAVGYALP